MIVHTSITTWSLIGVMMHINTSYASQQNTQYLDRNSPFCWPNLNSLCGLIHHYSRSGRVRFLRGWLLKWCTSAAEHRRSSLLCLWQALMPASVPPVYQGLISSEDSGGRLSAINPRHKCWFKLSLASVQEAWSQRGPAAFEPPRSLHTARGPSPCNRFPRVLFFLAFQRNVCCAGEMKE